MDIRNVTRVGCKRDASKALKGLLEPIGSGAYRQTYRDSRGEVAYKVCHKVWDGEKNVVDDRANRDEYETVSRCRTSPIGQDYVLPTTIWVIDGQAVLAQPMLVTTAAAVRDGVTTVPGVDQNTIWEVSDEIDNVAEELGVSDMHMKNWGFDPTGRPWMMDLNLSWSF